MSDDRPQAKPSREIYTVSRLNREAKLLLETALPPLWVEGEISNFAKPASGHWYFTLKDSGAQVRCTMWKQATMRVRVTPRDGMQVLLRIRVSLYELRGEYQLQVEQLEEAGEGALRFHTYCIYFGMQHTLRFHPQAQFQLIGREHFVIESTVLRCICVKLSAGILDEFHVFAAFDVLTAFKKKVLKTVRKAGALRIFVLRSYVIHYGNRHYRSRVVFLQNYMQAVWHGVFGNRDRSCRLFRNRQ